MAHGGAALVLMATADAQQRWFVKQGGTGTGFGVPALGAGNWASASGNLGTILANASPNDIIHVREGTYTPNVPPLMGPTAATFAFPPSGNDIELRGAYLGTENPYLIPPLGLPLGSPDNTILSGDLFNLNNPEVYHVVSITEGQDGILIDGFVIEMGLANGSTDDDVRCGGGLFVKESSSQGGTNSLRLSRVIFRNCGAALSGGGAYLWLVTDLGMKYCAFRNNVAFGQTYMGALIGGGGGLALVRASGSPAGLVNRIWSTDFILNRALHGGGVLGQDGDTGATVEVLNCKFTDNVARAGGGILLDGENGVRFEPVAHISYCTFAYNTVSAPTGATHVGGSAIYVGDNSALPSAELIRSCVSRFNKASFAGVAMTDGDIREGYYTPSGAPSSLTTVVRYSNVKRDTGPVGGPIVWPGVGNINTDPLFVNGLQRDLRLLSGSPCIDAGDDGGIPQDQLDLDDDTNFVEWAPRDFTPNVARELVGASGAPPGIDAALIGPVADMGCHEHIAPPPGT